MTYPTGTTQSDLNRHYNTPKGFYIHDGDFERPDDPDGYYVYYEDAVEAAKEELRDLAETKNFEIHRVANHLSLWEWGDSEVDRERTHSRMIEESY